jgi:hypothetical protein
MIEFYPPATPGEWLAFLTGLITLLSGLAALVVPRTTMRILHLRTTEDRPDAIAESRAALAGFRIGVGLVAILFAQPFVYLALGAGWALTAVGRLVSILFDRAASPRNLVLFLVEAALAVAAVADVFGLV